MSRPTIRGSRHIGSGFSGTVSWGGVLFSSATLAPGPHIRGFPGSPGECLPTGIPAPRGVWNKVPVVLRGDSTDPVEGSLVISSKYGMGQSRVAGLLRARGRGGGLSGQAINPSPLPYLAVPKRLAQECWLGFPIAQDCSKSSQAAIGRNPWQARKGP